jgi:hypothetical protein
MSTTTKKKRSKYIYIIIKEEEEGSTVPWVLKTMCHVSPGALSPVILWLNRHLPTYGSLGLYLLVTTPSSCFLETFSFLAGAGAAVVSVVETCSRAPRAAATRGYATRKWVLHARDEALTGEGEEEDRDTAAVAMAGNPRSEWVVRETSVEAGGAEEVRIGLCWCQASGREAR